MLMTLSIATLRPMLIARGQSQLDLLDVPAFARDTLNLHGLHLTTERLAGYTRTQLERLRDRADKAACSCLVLQETEPQHLAHVRTDVAQRAVERTKRVIEAAQILGCNAAVVSILGNDDDDAFDRAGERVREAVEAAERLEINLLLAPCEGLTREPDRVTDLIKKIGRFRVMTYPDFETASKAKDPLAYLRRLTPYAGALCASTVAFEGMEDRGETLLEDPEPRHLPYELRAMVETVLNVGYDGPMAIDYRGGGDVTLGALLSRSALEMAIEAAAP